MPLIVLVLCFDSLNPLVYPQMTWKTYFLLDLQITFVYPKSLVQHVYTLDWSKINFSEFTATGEDKQGSSIC